MNFNCNFTASADERRMHLVSWNRFSHVLPHKHCIQPQLASLKIRIE